MRVIGFLVHEKSIKASLFETQCPYELKQTFCPLNRGTNEVTSWISAHRLFHSGYWMKTWWAFRNCLEWQRSHRLAQTNGPHSRWVHLCAVIRFSLCFALSLPLKTLSLGSLSPPPVALSVQANERDQNGQQWNEDSIPRIICSSTQHGSSEMRETHSTQTYEIINW